MKSIAVVFFTVLLFACGNTKQIVVNKNFTPANYTVMGRAVKNNDGTVTLSASAAVALLLLQVKIAQCI